MSLPKFKLGTSHVQDGSIIRQDSFLGTDLSLSWHPDVHISDVNEAIGKVKERIRPLCLTN